MRPSRVRRGRGAFNLCYSAYTPKRTGSRAYCLNTPELLDVVEMMRDESNWIVNSRSTLEARERIVPELTGEQ